MTDDAERALMAPINRELARQVDNSDAALIERGKRDAARMFDIREGERFGRGVTVVYDDRAYWVRLGPGYAPGNATRYFATVFVWREKDRLQGKIDRKPPALANDPDDPLVRYLIDETGATP